MATYELIETITLGSNAESVTFSDIPQTFTDLKVVMSARTTDTSGDGYGVPIVRINNDSGANYSGRRIRATGSGVSAAVTPTTFLYTGIWTGAYATANSFTNSEFYIPNYTGSTYKSCSATSATESNTTLSYIELTASMWLNTAAITSIAIIGYNTIMVTNSSFSLYGIKKG